jgi:rhodanese-related sulfurtransferase
MTRQQITNILSWILLTGVILYFAYAKGWIFAPFESITPQQAHELLQNDPNVTLLDVRTPEEFAEEHIAEATLIPLQILEENIPKLSNAKETKIIVYCRSGTRSVAASRILTENGFDVLNVKGGINGWKDAGYEVVR